jgi:hypothetical protein
LGEKEGNAVTLGIESLAGGFKRLSDNVHALESRSSALSTKLDVLGPAQDTQAVPATSIPNNSATGERNDPTPPPVPIPAYIDAWLPAGQDGALGWRPSYPELCSANAVTSSSSNKLPGYNSKRFAFVFRGDAFRGLTLGVTPCYTVGDVKHCDKLPFYCTDEAVAIQKATAKAQVALMVEPLEAAGYTVDVYIATYGCNGLPHVPADTASQYHNELLGIFGARVVASSFFEREPGQTQDTGTRKAVELLLTKAPLDYRSILLWRYDMVPVNAMMKTHVQEGASDYRIWHHWQSFDEDSREQFLWFEGQLCSMHF